MAMTPEFLGLIQLGALLTAIFLGFPIAFTLIILAIVFGYIGFGGLVFDLMVIQTFGFMQEEVLAAVPLFLFMGYILERAGIIERLFKACQLIMGGVRGSLYLVVMVTTTIFATATGIIGACITVIGLLAVPPMMKSKYDQRLSAGVITAGGCLGIIIPPSVMLVLLGPVAGVSVMRLFAAALLPGLLLSVIFIGYAMFKSYRNPELGPPLPPEERATSVGHAIKELVLGIIPAALLIFAALGSILMGMATPTEAAAMGAAGAVVLSLLYGRLDLQKVKESAFLSLQTSSLVLFLGVAANCFAAVFGRLGTGAWVTQSLLALNVHPFVMLVLLMVFIFLLGWPLEWPAIILIFLPMFLPLVEELGFDMVWFCIIVSMNLLTAFLSPPVAMAAYYLKGVAPELDLKDIYWGMLDFMWLQCLGLIIVMIFPQIALWLPEVLFGR
jgi:tripartite ATP-independent transporter DctM subunit